MVLLKSDLQTEQGDADAQGLEGVPKIRLKTGCCTYAACVEHQASTDGY